MPRHFFVFLLLQIGHAAPLSRPREADSKAAKRKEVKRRGLSRHQVWNGFMTSKLWREGDGPRLLLAADDGQRLPAIDVS